jgi:hypothetical protein
MEYLKAPALDVRPSIATVVDVAMASGVITCGLGFDPSDTAAARAGTSGVLDVAFWTTRFN